MSINKLLTALAFAASAYTVALASAISVKAAGPDLFQVSSPAFADDGMLAPKNAATGNSVRGNWACGGGDVSPPVAWSHAPEATKSFAIVMQDPDAQLGMGALHWMTYGIPASAHEIEDGAANRTPDPFKHGALRTKQAYSGPCSEPGATPHHFLIKVFALDLTPDELPSDLSLDEFMAKIKGHSLTEASLIARYTPPAKESK